MKRDPKHYEAGLLMAELLIVQQQPDHCAASACATCGQSASGYPRDARHGGVAGGGGKAARSVGLVSARARLAPDNQEYKLSCQASARRSSDRVAVQSATTGTEPKRADATPKPAEAPIATASRTDAEFAVVADHEPTPPAVSNANAARLVSGAAGSLQRTTPASRRRKPLPRRRPGAESNGAESNGSESNGSEQLLEYGEAALTAGARKDARGYFQRARRAAPDDVKIAVSAAVIAVKHDELEMAIEIVQDGLKAFPGSSGLYRLLGVAQYRLGDMQAAKASFEQSLSLDKSNPLSYFLMGSTLKKLGQSEAAEQYLVQARRLDPRYAARR